MISHLFEPCTAAVDKEGYRLACYQRAIPRGTDCKPNLSARTNLHKAGLFGVRPHRQISRRVSNQ